MNYRAIWTVAGLMMLVKPLLTQRFQPPSIKGIIETAHYLPGRLRLMVPSLVGQPDMAAKLEKQLQTLDQVESVEARSRSGSVVICYDPLVIEPLILFGVTVRMLGLEEKLDNHEPSVLWRELRAAGRGVDAAIYSKTAGFIDTKTLVTLLIMGAVGYRLIRQPTRSFAPGTITLGWWLFNLIFMRQGIP